MQLRLDVLHHLKDTFNNLETRSQLITWTQFDDESKLEILSPTEKENANLSVFMMKKTLSHVYSLSFAYSISF